MFFFYRRGESLVQLFEVLAGQPPVGGCQDRLAWSLFWFHRLQEVQSCPQVRRSAAVAESELDPVQQAHDRRVGSNGGLAPYLSRSRRLCVLYEFPDRLQEWQLLILVEPVLPCPSPCSFFLASLDAFPLSNVVAVSCHDPYL